MTASASASSASSFSRAGNTRVSDGAAARSSRMSLSLSRWLDVNTTFFAGRADWAKASAEQQANRRRLSVFMADFELRIADGKAGIGEKCSGDRKGSRLPRAGIQS
jgi:hypothetical protein